MLCAVCRRANVILGIWRLVLWLVLYGYADGAWGAKARAVMGSLHWAAHLAMMIPLYYAVSYASIFLVDNVWPQAREVLQTFELKSSPDVRELFRHHRRVPAVDDLRRRHRGRLRVGRVPHHQLPLRAALRPGVRLDGVFPISRTSCCMKVEPNKLTIYPIGLRRTPRRWGWKRAKDRGFGDTGGPAIVPTRPLRAEPHRGPDRDTRR